jgi:hypothetical protein
MRRLALRSALSDKAANGGMIVVDDLTLTEARTKVMITTLAGLGVAGKTILVVPAPDSALRKASGNLQDVHVALPNGLSVVELLQADYVVFSRGAVESVTQLLLGESTVEVTDAKAEITEAKAEVTEAKAAPTASRAVATEPKPSATEPKASAAEPKAATQPKAAAADAEEDE